MHELFFLLALIPSYIIGALPVGRIIAKAHGVDITQRGSGNVGATNVGRVLGPKAGSLTLVLDILKGSLAVLIARLFTDDIAFHAAAGAAAVYGHCFSLPGKLRGGKGVATSLGAVALLSPLVAISAIGIFVLTFSLSHVVSLSSITSALFSPLLALMLTDQNSVFFATVAIAAVVVFRHKDNLQRLVEGREGKFCFGRVRKE